VGGDRPVVAVGVGSGRRWRDHLQVINAILWKLRTGAPWRDLPERYGPWKTAHERLRLWTRTASGTGSLRVWWSRTTRWVPWNGW
jgi:transposase